MQFNHDNMTGVLLSVELANLADELADELALESAEAVAERLGRVLADHVIRRPQVSAADAAPLVAWAGRLRAVFEADGVEQRCATVNGLLAEAAPSVHLSAHDGRRPHLHFVPDDEGVVPRVRSVTAGGLALFVVESAGERLHACAREGCARVFVDTSRNGRRRYCSARCGNHDAVRRHRDGARSASGG